MNRIKNLNEAARKQLAEDYIDLANYVGLDDYKKMKVISHQIYIDDRKWRKIVEDLMHLYMYGYVDKMIVSSPKGYILTNDPELIDKFLKAKEHQFKALAYNCYHLRKALLHKDNYTINDFIEESL